jgi:hypothetical protein
VPTSVAIFDHIPRPCNCTAFASSASSAVDHLVTSRLRFAGTRLDCPFSCPDKVSCGVHSVAWGSSISVEAVSRSAIGQEYDVGLQGFPVIDTRFSEVRVALRRQSGNDEKK